MQSTARRLHSDRKKDGKIIFMSQMTAFRRLQACSYSNKMDSSSNNLSINPVLLIRDQYQVKLKNERAS